ncbi:MAG TPA: J domain-containing protein [Caulobacteraceae bacterium]
MEAQIFINYYEILNLDPSATAEAIDREFRHLARQYHPDNQATGDRVRFDAVMQAHDVLKDPGLRAQYHEDNTVFLPPLGQPFQGERRRGPRGRRATDAADEFFQEIGLDRDTSIQNNILVLLYFRRRQSPREPGIGDAELERLSGCPPEHLEFHIWYLKHKKWVATGEDGLLAITIDGVDRASCIYQESAAKMITAQSQG